MGHPRPVLFSIQTNTITIFTANLCEKCPSKVRCRDSNPWTSEHESPPITTITGLPPNMKRVFLCNQVNQFFFNQFSSSNNYYLSLAVRFWVAKYVNIERVWIKNGINFICLFRFLNKIRTKFLKIGFCCFIAAAVSFVFKAKNRIRSRGQASGAACFFCIVRNSYPLSLSHSQVLHYYVSSPFNLAPSTWSTNTFEPVPSHYLIFYYCSKCLSAQIK